jgi:ABC-type multidrug transport system fused ATPase/permease subunit
VRLLLRFYDAGQGQVLVDGQDIRSVTQKSLRERMAFVTSHRLSLIRNADTILVFDGGRIGERGSHARLMEHGGLYAHLHELQMGVQPAGNGK